MTPGAKFSTMTSARFTMFLTRSSPRSDLRLTVMDFLLALNNRKYQESWLGPDCRPNNERPASPPCGFSTLTTSAPSQASASVQDGPASNWVRSRTRTPARQPRSAPLAAICSFLPLGFEDCTVSYSKSLMPVSMFMTALGAKHICPGKWRALVTQFSESPATLERS